MSENNENTLNINEGKCDGKIEEKVEDLFKSRNKEISNIYSNCLQTNFTIASMNRAFLQPFSIEKSSLNYNSLNISESKRTKKPYVVVNNASIFIGGRQNLKGMRVYLSNNYKYNNTAHREITDFRNNKNKSVDKNNYRLIENKLVEKVNIDLSENNNKNNKKDDTNKNKDNSVDPLKIINLRWKNNQKVNKTSLSYINRINRTESILLNKKKYIQELLNTININSSKSKTNNKIPKEKYILIKQDKYNQNNNLIHEIISPNTYEEFEASINSFIEKSDNNNKENQDNNNISNDASSQENQENYLNNGKKKSKFSSKKDIQTKKTKDKLKDDFIPIFILTKKDIEMLYEIIEKPSKAKIKKMSSYSIDNKIFVNIIKHNNCEKLRGAADNKSNKNQKTLEDINFDIFPVKVEKFELINIVPNEVRTNYNIDVSNIALNQSDYMKQGKGGENEFDLLLNKNKETEDFSQNTPISLLQEKYFIYAVSKWIKYSIPYPQSQMYVKYSYKTGHPMFDPINLIMTNFTLWIERIETKRNDNKKAMISISSSINYNSLKNKNGRGKSINSTSSKKKGYVNIYSNQTNNNSIENNNQLNKKRNGSKAKIYK